MPCTRSSPDELVAQVAAALPATTKLAVFDAVTSNTGVVLPIEGLVALCKERWALIRGCCSIHPRDLLGQGREPFSNIPQKHPRAR